MHEIPINSKLFEEYIQKNSLFEKARKHLKEYLEIWWEEDSDAFLEGMRASFEKVIKEYKFTDKIVSIKKNFLYEPPQDYLSVSICIDDEEGDWVSQYDAFFDFSFLLFDDVLDDVNYLRSKKKVCLNCGITLHEPPINSKFFEEYIQKNGLLEKTREFLREYFESYYNDTPDLFVEDMGVPFEKMMKEYRFRLKTVEIKKNFLYEPPRDYLAVSIWIENEKGDYISENTVFFDFLFEVFDDTATVKEEFH